MAAQPPRPRLPPLLALRAFEAAGRLGGFTPAALELGVTPGAITAHLKTLENSLGVALFDRHHRGVALTDLGARVLPEFSAAFAALDSAVHRLEAEAAPDQVRIATSADLAQLWLSPRLPRLRAAGVQVAPLLLAGPEAARGLAELALFFASGARPLAPLIAIAAPGRAPATPQALDPRACLTLGGPEGDWASWCAAAAIPAFRPRGPVHASAALALEEVANGAGMLVIAAPLALAALAAGRVVEPFAIRAPGTTGLALTPLRPVAPESATARVMALLADEIQADRGA